MKAKHGKNHSAPSVPRRLEYLEGPLHVGRPNIGSEKAFLKRVKEIFRRRWLTNNGPFVQEFEKELSAYLGVKHCIVMCNATVALEIAIRAAGLKGEVIVPSFTFIATAHSLQWQEITPVFCDIDAATHCIDPARVEDLITPKTTGIMGVHVWGRPCNIEALEKLARKRKLTLMFDAAHAFGCSYKGRKIGGFGLAEVFSFHATKMFNTFEGGAITTNDDAFAKKIRLMKNFGFAGYDNVIYVGTNGKMPEICAAMGLTNLESIGVYTAKNRENYGIYRKELAGVPGVTLIDYDDKESSNYQYIVLELDGASYGMSRDELLKALHADNILARRYFFPGCHRMEPYLSNFPHAGLLLPETEKLTEKVLVLPTGTAIGRKEIKRICTVIKSNARPARAF